MSSRVRPHAVAVALLMAFTLVPGSTPAGAQPDRERPDKHPAAEHPHPKDFPPGAAKPEKESPYANKKKGGGGDGGSEDPQTAPSLAPTTVSGTAYLPVILVDFADNPAERLVHTQQAFQDMLFQKGYPYGAGSMRDYYLNQSGGLFDVTGEVTPWLPMPRTYSTYVGSKSGYQTTEPNDFTLVKDAVVAADPLVDFCKGDTNSDGLVDTLFVVHAGPGGEEVAGGIWSIKWSLPTAFTTNDVCANGSAVKVKTFTIEPEEYATDRFTPTGAPSRMVSIGVFCHEFGHILGLPDLYDTDYSGGGHVGTWDVMATGTYGFTGRRPWRPVPFSAWSKVQLGWAQAQNVTQDSVQVPIPSADGGHSGIFKGVYRIAAGGSSTASEYFLVENRRIAGYAADFPSGGIAVWHVDASRSNNADDSRPLLQLVQADGYGELAGTGALGDGGDLFPGSATVRGIDQSTSPSTDLHSGADTGIAIWRISNPAATTVVDFYLSPGSPRPSFDGGGTTEPRPTPLPNTSPTPVGGDNPLTDPLDDVLPRADGEAPAIGNVSDEPDPFTPGSGGRTGRVDIYFKLSENAVVTIGIYNSKGKLVKRLLRRQPRSGGLTSSVVWTGKNSEKKIVPAGKYVYKIKAEDSGGNIGRARGTVTVRR